MGRIVELVIVSKNCDVKENGVGLWQKEVECTEQREWALGQIPGEHHIQGQLGGQSKASEQNTHRQANPSQKIFEQSKA